MAKLAKQSHVCRGLVIKYNQNQRYATNSVTATLFKQAAVKRGIPCQVFVVRSDMPCGSTIGPILASGLGVRTVDVGVAQFAMHSIREMCGVDDIKHAYDHFVAFFEEFGGIDAKLDVDACMVQPDGKIDDVPCECL
jgi:aspartyl aminopeptidase